MGGKGGSTKADKTGVLNGLGYLPGPHFIDVPRLKVADLLAVPGIDLENEAHRAGPLGRRPELKALDDSGRGGVLGDGYKSTRLGHKLAPKDFLTHVDDRLGRCARVLGEGNDQFGREGQTADRFTGGEVLVLGRMNPVREGITKPVTEV